jgi:hypothetical protein
MRRGLAAVLLGALALAYALSLHLWHGAARPVSAALAGGGLLVFGELAFGLADRGRATAGERRRAAGWLGACALGGTAAAIVVLVVASLDVARSVGLTIAGTVAAVAVVWLLVSTAARTGEDSG